MVTTKYSKVILQIINLIFFNSEIFSLTLIKVPELVRIAVGTKEIRKISERNKGKTALQAYKATRGAKK